jgi:predicted ArsR family transcriptional regulator
MPRRTADQRHADTAPSAEGPEVIEQLIAYHHPTRQRILETISVHGPASVGMIADRLGIAPGSVSHHLKPLHRGGFVEPAPELAPDTRASWWRLGRTSVSYDALDYPAGSRAREVVSLAERANDDRHVTAMRRWRTRRHELPEPWRRAGGSSDTAVAATAEQVVELQARLDDVLRAWAHEVHEDQTTHPDADRRHVLAFAHVVPSVQDGTR